MIISIDGFSATGKSAVGKNLATRLKIKFISSGCIYRAITYLAITHIRFFDEDNKNHISRLLTLLKRASIKFDNGLGIYIDKKYYLADLRTRIIDETVPNISELPEVREVVSQILTETVGNQDYVIDGRDIGSVVFPNAQHKYFFVLNGDQELLISSLPKYETLIDPSNISDRDWKDILRIVSPLRKAPDAKIFYSFNQSLLESVTILEKSIRGYS
jgi:CMP/dCMP kinase